MKKKSKFQNIFDFGLTRIITISFISLMFCLAGTALAQDECYDCHDDNELMGVDAKGGSTCRSAATVFSTCDIKVKTLKLLSGAHGQAIRTSRSSHNQ